MNQCPNSSNLYNRMDNKDKSSSEHKSKSRSRSREKQHESPNSDEDEMIKIMGFSSFSTSKNKNHTKSAVEGVKKNSNNKRVYRQYMNRRGGFNRNLDKI